jgi:hypothetical protein
MNINNNLPTTFVAVFAIGLFVIGVWHIVKGEATERIFSSQSNVRIAGAALLLLAIPCFLWGGVFFLVLGTLLGLSGVLRLFTASWNIALQRKTWPRWGHGCIMVAIAIATWLIYRLTV